MGLTAALAATALCVVIYVRMIKRELPEPIGKKQAAIPAGFGVLAVLLTTPLLILIGLLVQKLTGGGSLSGKVTSPILSSIVRSFLLAGFTEEFIKCLMFLIVIRIVRPKNVYEYGFLCAGIGLGFTFLEDLVYAGQNPVSSVIRILFFAMHMMFGILMGTHLGLAKYCKQEQQDGAGKHIFLAFFLPILWHTLFDASTITNVALNTEDESIEIAGVIVGIVACMASIALQFVLLVRFRKKTEEYCGMQLIEQKRTEKEPV